MSNPSDPQGGNGNSDNDRLKNWEEDLKDVCNKLKIACAKKDQAEVAYNTAKIWEGKLKSYHDAIDSTIKITDDIENVLDQFKCQIELICKNTECLIEASEILYCMVIKSFECIDELKNILTTVMKDIECLNLPDLNPKTSIVLQCLNNICIRVDEARSNQHDLIKQVIQVLKCAQELNEMICGENCGLNHIVKQICTTFLPESTGGEGTGDCDDEDIPDAGNEICGCTITSCKEITLEKPKFPLMNSTYYEEIGEEYEASKIEKKCLKDAFNEKRSVCDELTACKKNLEDAIAASKAAKECK